MEKRCLDNNSDIIMTKGYSINIDHAKYKLRSYNEKGGEGRLACDVTAPI